MNLLHVGLWSSFGRRLLRLLRLVVVLPVVVLAVPVLLMLGIVAMMLELGLSWLARHALGLLMWGLALGLVWGLSGCGTVPLPGTTRLLVPAALLTPPAQPVPLTLGSGLRMPGKTTSATPRLAPWTGSGTKD